MAGGYGNVEKEHGMTFVRYSSISGPAYAVVELEVAYVLEGDPFVGGRRGTRVDDVAALRLLPPVTPSKVVAIGRNYAAHAAEHDAPVPDEPLIFLKPPSALVGPDEPIVLPALSKRVEHEAELAAVIGTRCRNVPEEDAWEVILGYTCANDVTARDLQRRDGQWSRSKGFDTFCPLGPLVVPLAPERVGDLEVVCRVNGEERQRASTADLIFPVPRLIAAVSAVMTLEPGDVILTGTPAGVGPLGDGDVVEVEVEGVGVLRNPVVGLPMER
jgi:2-keto-4-pentenoate hydratase/2-oxohepta-3-ene-1,7-dioic acid hydratase in catechol pathway